MKDRHSYKSTLIISHLPINKSYLSIDETTLANVTLDQLIHNANKLSRKVESMQDNFLGEAAAS